MTNQDTLRLLVSDLSSEVPNIDTLIDDIFESEDDVTDCLIPYLQLKINQSGNGTGSANLAI